MSGTRVVATDVDSGDSEERTIVDDFMLITDGCYYLDGIVSHSNGTVILTVKKRKP